VVTRPELAADSAPMKLSVKGPVNWLALLGEYLAEEYDAASVRIEPRSKRLGRLSCEIPQRHAKEVVRLCVGLPSADVERLEGQ
jgi:hypothetical protein